MMIRRIEHWRGYVVWARRMPQATGVMFAARSPWGRSIKIFLFGIGVLMPLGSLIWALLFWHGYGVQKRPAALADRPQRTPLAMRGRGIRRASRLAETPDSF